MNNKLIEEYAKLIVEVGINLQKDQYVFIQLLPELEDFATIVAKHCYLNGAKRVIFNYYSQKQMVVEQKYSTLENLSIVTPIEESIQQFKVDNNPCLIWLDGDDPDGLNDIDPNKYAKVRQNKMKILKKYIDQCNNKYQWTIVGVPTKKWAKKVFPALNEDEAVEKLFEKILFASRVSENDSVENWKKHQTDLQKRYEYLNSLNLVKLHYTSKKGTDLTIGLIEGVKFLAGSEKDLFGHEFQPNIPTEECFTSPKKGEAEGIVYASKPLVYNGQMIEDFSIRFEKGKAVEVKAKKGKEVLESILSLDEGSSYLGECAFVPYNSPINQTGILFYNTLFDENAACHLALGEGFTNLYPDYEKYSDEEIHKFGINESFSHVDFMIGDETLSVVGTTKDNKEVVIFKDGNWAF